MKIKFDANQLHQRTAWESAIGVFEGQELNKTTFSMPSVRPVGELEAKWSNQTDTGYGNRLRLLDEELLANVQRIQLKNGLKQSTDLATRDFTIEMETGTGKTYVYLRSIFEMNKLYGFTKFIIVVPSIAIKEGVAKSLKMTETHFKEQYDNTPYDWFVYNSADLPAVRNFALNDYIQIMVINIDAFRKGFADPDKESSANIIHRYNDKMQGIPINFIKETNPIVIIDEPQSVDTTEASSKAIASLNPLCTFRYSATHVDKHNMLYKLDSIDAYDQKLVKQIEVAAIEVKDGHNKAYIKLLSVNNKKSPITAKVELDVQQDGSVKRKAVTVKQGSDLLEASKGRSIYDGYVVNDIVCEEGNEYIDFTSKGDVIRLGDAIGEVNVDEYKRLQIRKTIEEHLDKELKLTPMGIKVLSLFFIDKVANYRDYDAPDTKGKYARIFEEEYAKAIKKPKYSTLFKDVDTDTLPQDVHNGYFSEDKKTGRLKDSKESKDGSGGSSKDDEDTYALIMSKKEELLSFASKLKFIFSHSALKEGWDNPNVFQICTLNETNSVIKKRQEIGRGLRICVNQNGDRVHGFDVNTLTVMANESYEAFVEGLQKEIEKEEGIKFGIVEQHTFANLVIQGTDGKDEYLGAAKSEDLHKHLLASQYIDQRGKIQDKLKKDLKEGKVELPPAFVSQTVQINVVLKKIAGGLNIQNNDNKRTIKLNKAVFESPEFKELWDKVKFKTTYNVEFDPAALIQKCSEELKKNIIVGKTKFTYITAKVGVERSGLTTKEDKNTPHTYDAKDYQIPDILSYLQNETNLKRQTILEILLRSERLDDFKNNPQKFLDQAKSLIKSTMQSFIVDGIKYQKIGDQAFYAQELFESEELIGYLNKNMLEAGKSVYDHVIYDSETVEAELAQAFEKNEQVKVYAKLPSWFKVNTPLGTYNPDWAVLFDIEGQEHLYFVVESKETHIEELLRKEAQGKIKCGRAHFEALGADTNYVVASNMDTLMDQVTAKAG